MVFGFADYCAAITFEPEDVVSITIISKQDKIFTCERCHTIDTVATQCLYLLTKPLFAHYRGTLSSSQCEGDSHDPRLSHPLMGCPRF